MLAQLDGSRRPGQQGTLGARRHPARNRPSPSNTRRCRATCSTSTQARLHRGLAAHAGQDQAQALRGRQDLCGADPAAARRRRRSSNCSKSVARRDRPSRRPRQGRRRRGRRTPSRELDRSVSCRTGRRAPRSRRPSGPSRTCWPAIPAAGRSTCCSRSLSNIASGPEAAGQQPQRPAAGQQPICSCRSATCAPSPRACRRPSTDMMQRRRRRIRQRGSAHDRRAACRNRSARSTQPARRWWTISIRSCAAPTRMSGSSISARSSGRAARSTSISHRTSPNMPTSRSATGPGRRPIRSAGPFRPTTLQSFQHASQIRDAFFASGGCPALLHGDRDAAGRHRPERHGPDRFLRHAASWASRAAAPRRRRPGRAPGSYQLKITVTTIAADPAQPDADRRRQRQQPSRPAGLRRPTPDVSTLANKNGVWALFRLLDDAGRGGNKRDLLQRRPELRVPVRRRLRREPAQPQHAAAVPLPGNI